MHFEEQALTAHPSFDLRLRQAAGPVELALYCLTALLALVLGFAAAA